jgi:hypothetical protein
MHRKLAVALTALALALAAAPAHADLEGGRNKVVAGDYKAATAELARVSGKDRSAARLLLARAQLETGDYAAAEATAASVASASAAKDPL